MLQTSYSPMMSEDYTSFESDLSILNQIADQFIAVTTCNDNSNDESFPLSISQDQHRSRDTSPGLSLSEHTKSASPHEDDLTGHRSGDINCLQAIGSSSDRGPSSTGLVNDDPSESDTDKCCYDSGIKSPPRLIGFTEPQESVEDELIDHEYETDYSVYENKTGLADDMKFLASMPELCDVTFLVGETREPVCAVRSVLAARSRTFHKMLYSHKKNYPSALSSITNGVQTNGNTQLNNPGSQPPQSKDSVPGDVGTRSSSEATSGRTPSLSGQREKQIKYSKSKKFRETAKENRLKLFLKRSSEPSINGISPNNHELTFQPHQTMIIEEFEPDVFRQLIEYIHTGCVTLQARTLLGLLNAADYYGLEALRKACTGFVACCITVDTVCALLASAERYIQYKCTKSLVQKVLEFVDQHGNEVLSLGSFALLPEHVVRLILSREELKADELTKFHAALAWSQRYCDASPTTADLRDVMSGFFECIEFYKIPATVLMREVHPLTVVPDHVIMNALAFQADPRSVDMRKIESPNRFRRMTLPHALNIAGSDLLSLRQGIRSERSASTSTSGYISTISTSDLNHVSSGASGTASSGNKEDKLKRSKEGSKKTDNWKEKLGKRRSSRPFRRAKTLLDGA
ncbi:speckle type BTB/POZ protein [Brevipalpus obovatus]|uniref:speckle type BTB/POZ protein n=1 Tax=Brevipalpus obovatus TaxID=246614 RepID=UPI003D9F4811